MGIDVSMIDQFVFFLKNIKVALIIQFLHRVKQIFKYVLKFIHLFNLSHMILQNNVFKVFIYDVGLKDF